MEDLNERSTSTTHQEEDIDKKALGKAQQNVHHEKEDWQVKWGFDPGDCFTVFPLLPKLPGESDSDRWSRSFVPLRDASEMLCIESNAMETLLREILEDRFDTSIDHGRGEMFPRYTLHFDWYFDNAYTVDSCRDICSLMRNAAKKLAELPRNTTVRIAATGSIVACQPPEDDWWYPPTAADARRNCLLIAKHLERIAASAERQGATVSFSGP